MSPSSDRWSSAVREVLSPRYEFHSHLGRGGFASVWKVTNRRLGRVEALKVLADVRGEDAEFVERFTREAQIAAALDHPNIVRIHEFGCTDGIFWYSMQFVDGPTLADELRRGRTFSPGEVVEIVVQVLDALGVIHDRGVVHRDLKPANLVLDAAGRPYVMDFGIAKVDGPPGVTATGALMGTPAYLAPEALAGSPIDGRADLYALGVTAYEMLSGRLPYASVGTAHLLAERVLRAPLPLASAMPEVPPGLSRVVMQALSLRPEDRAQGAREMAAAWRDALAGPRTEATHRSSFAPRRRGEGVVDAAAKAPGPVTRPGGSWRRAAVLALSLAALVVALGWLVSSPTARSGAVPSRAADRAPASALPAGSSPVATPPVEAAGPAVAASVAPPAVRVARAERTVPEATASARAAGAPGAGRDLPPGRPVTAPLLVDAPVVELAGDLVASCRGLSLPFAVEVDVTGRVVASRSLRPVAPACREAAEGALRGYVFKPALDATGVPVAARVSLAVTF